MNNAHLMLDIETMDVQHSAAIVAIGAVVFDPRRSDKREDLTNCFSAKVSLESNAKAGRSMSASTIQWWLNQSKAAQEATFLGETLPLGLALREFVTWVAKQEVRPTRIWAKDPDFDCVIVQDACQQMNERWPFKFWESRSVRTIQELAFPDGDHPTWDTEEGGVQHDALSDAKAQVLMVQLCHEILAT